MNQNNQSGSGTQATSGQVYANGLTYDEIVHKDIIDLMGIKNITPEKRQELHEKINTAIENRVAARIFDELKESEREEWDSLLKTEKYKEASEYLKSKDINCDQWLINEALLMKIELYEDSRVVRRKAEELLKEAERPNDAN